MSEHFIATAIVLQKMQLMRKFFRVVAVISMAFAIAIMTAVVTYNIIIPSNFNVIRDDKETIPNPAELTGTDSISFDKSSAVSSTGVIPKTMTMKLFNLIPIKTTQISVVEKQKLTPGGTPFGIKLFTRGVMVVSVNSVESFGGVKNPTRLAGILKGDVLLSMNSIELTSNEQVADIIEKSGGHDVTVTLQRGGKLIKTILSPAISIIDEKYKAGLWVRDSSAGIGTVTYFSQDNLAFGGLGHGICDVDTGKIMPLSSGEVCAVKINSLQKGRAGIPGEIHGSFASDDACGRLYANNESGIFGVLNEPPNELNAVEIVLKQNVVPGAAKIICTLDNNGPVEYDIIIEKIDLNPKNMTKNMVISITDADLLNRTGGIIQGMSGSPILQKGKLVGAVTHVFVNNPQKGYGIFIENMLAVSTP